MLKEFVKRDRENKKLSIAVVGDSMLDEYYNVNISRVSPEYPVSVLESESFAHDTYPGGAANVCYQFSNFNVDVKLFSFLDLVSSYIFKDIFNINIISSIQDERISVPIKRRFQQGNHQIIRWDIEKQNYGLPSDLISSFQESLITRFKNFEFDVVVFSDYDKGVFSNYFSMDLCRVHTNSILLIDPKKGPLERKWIGHSKDIIKPNFKEACEISKYQNPEDQLRFIQNMTGMSPVITKGGEGVYWFDDSVISHYKSQNFINPVSVIGAGDCFISFLAMARGRDFSLSESIQIAYEASSKYILGKYNKPLYPIDILSEKYISPQDLKNRDFYLVFSNGCFDLFHCGHLSTLKFAKSKGDKLVVAINSDESVKRLKGETRPILNLEERIKVLSALECVDYVVSFEEDTPEEVIKTIRPDFIVKGPDYSSTEVVGSEYVKNVFIAPHIENISTTSIINRII